MHVVLALHERTHKITICVVAAGVVRMRAVPNVLAVQHLLGVGSGNAALVQA